MTDFYGLQSLLVRRMVVDGESFALLLNGNSGFSIRLIDAEQVDASLNRVINDGRIVQGVEFNNQGRRVAYWILPERPGCRSLWYSKRCAFPRKILFTCSGRKRQDRYVGSAGSRL